MIKKNEKAYFVSVMYEDAPIRGVEEIKATTILSGVVIGATNCFYTILDEAGFEIKKKKHNVYETEKEASGVLRKMVKKAIDNCTESIEWSKESIEKNKSNIEELKVLLKTI